MFNLRALPLLAIALILYNVIVFIGGADVMKTLSSPVFTVTMLRGGQWSFTVGDLILLIAIVLFFIEIVKATFTGSAAILDHALSMVVFIIALLEFLMVRQAATSVFFFIVLLAMIDVIAGYTIGIRTARRDINFGAPDV
jgi:hypothetical protein